MFAGKTDELVRRVGEASKQSGGWRAFKPHGDTRHAVDEIVSHSGVRLGASAVGDSRQLALAASGYDVIGIDEVQFFDPGLVAVSTTLRMKGIRVIAAGLDRDFRGEVFPTTDGLLKAADDVSLLRATCTSCGDLATLTQRLYAGVPAPLTDAIVVVGDAVIYEPRCVRCYAAERAQRSAAQGSKSVRSPS